MLVTGHTASSSVLPALRAWTRSNLGAGQFPHTPGTGKTIPDAASQPSQNTVRTDMMALTYAGIA